MVRGNYPAHLVDELDYSLCAAVSRGRLSSEDESGRSKVTDASVLYAVVYPEYRESVEKLALIFVKALYLNVEYEIRVCVDIVVSLDEVRELFFLVLLDVDEAAEDILVVSVLSKLLELVKVIYPAVIADKLGNERRKLLIAESYPAALSYAVSLVAESLGIKAEPICKDGIFQYLSVYLGNAVYMAGRIASHISHVDKASLDNLYAVYFVLRHIG